MQRGFLDNVRQYLTFLREFLFPRLCLVCGRRLAVRERSVCTGCLSRLPYTHDEKNSENNLVRLFYGQLNVVNAYAYIFYHAGSDVRNILFALKYNHQPDVGRYFGKLIALELRNTTFFKDVDLLIPVPLARKRQQQRGYNQSEMLACGLAEITHLPIGTDLVIRCVENPTQTHLNVLQRRENVKGIFKCVKPELLENKHVLLVDDVVTTGATLCSCMKSMEAIPNIRFSVITLAQAAANTSLPGYIVPDFDV